MITQAVLALSKSVRETQQALLLLTPPESDEFEKHLDVSIAAMALCFEHLQNLVDLIDKGHG